MRRICHLDCCSTKSYGAGSVPSLPDKAFLDSQVQRAEQNVGFIRLFVTCNDVQLIWKEDLTVKLDVCAWGSAINDKASDRMNKRVLIAAVQLCQRKCNYGLTYTVSTKYMLLNIPFWEFNSCVLIPLSVLIFIVVVIAFFLQNRQVHAKWQDCLKLSSNVHGEIENVEGKLSVSSCVTF